MLEAVCDTVVPALERPDDPDGFWARSAGDVGAPAALEALLELRPPEEQLGIDQLLDGLGRVRLPVLVAAARASRCCATSPRSRRPRRPASRRSPASRSSSPTARPTR